MSALQTVRPNAFQRHGINHLSASTINLFAAEPALFVMEKLLKRRGSVGCAAHRGTAAEAGIVAGLLNPEMSIEECQGIGVTEFDRLACLSADPKRETERKAVPGIISVGIPELRKYGIPLTQVKVEKALPGVSVPWIGYIDLFYPEHGILIDIKSQLRLASEISTSHARQVALYTHDTNHEARVAYITPAKIGVYRLEGAEQHLADLANIARRLEIFLSLSDDPDDLAAFVVPNVDSFYFNDPTTRAMCREVYGL